MKKSDNTLSNNFREFREFVADVLIKVSEFIRPK